MPGSSRRAAMLRNYVTIAVRNLKRRAGYTLLNAFGIAVGLACCLLIGLFVYDEFSYDRFHTDADRLYFVTQEATFAGERRVGMSSYRALARAMEREIPGVEVSSSMTYTGPSPVRQPESEHEGEYLSAFADSTFLEMFSFPLVAGDPATALDAPHSVVITEAMAQTLFGEVDPLGQILEIDRFGPDSVGYTVTGVLAPLPRNSFFRFDALMSISSLRGTNVASGWGGSMYFTFARLTRSATVDGVRDGLERVVEAHLPDPLADHRYDLVPITGLYLSEITGNDGFGGSTRYLLIFGSIALFILLLAVINYMNLATAQATQRVREVGVRKTLGARRGQIARQFLVESLLVTGVAAVLGLGLAALALPVFNDLFGKEMMLLGGLHPMALLAGVGIVVGVGLVAGGYPALYLSRFRPTRLLQHEAGGRGSGGWLRRVLVVTQFTVTTVLLVATAVVYQQLRFIQDQDLGFAGEQVLVVPFADQAMSFGHDAVKQAVLDLPGAVLASATSASPGRYRMSHGTIPDPNTPDRYVNFRAVDADADYIQTLGLKLVAGRDFDPNRPSDEESAFILNESGFEALEGIASLGDPIEGLNPDGMPSEIIGIVEDYHYTSLREPIEPVLIRVRQPGERSWPDYHSLMVRFRPEQTRELTAGLGQIWEEFGARRTPDVRFLDDEFAAMYATEQRLGQVFGVFGAVAVVIACLGLFGLAAYATERRTKEIGVRKVLGASVTSLITMLSKEFLTLVAISLAVAGPVAYLLTQRWLDDFAYRIELGPALFLAVAAVALSLALLAVAYHTVRAASADPVEALRYE